jgi:hypothetical protein
LALTHAGTLTAARIASASQGSALALATLGHL